MTAERPCKGCGDIFPATAEYFYNTQGHYLSHKCKKCRNADTVKRTRELRRIERENLSRIPRQTPRQLTKTPEYAEHRHKIRILDQRWASAKQRGASESASRIKRQMDELRAIWYQNLAVRG
jgi:hypothetical protein